MNESFQLDRRYPPQRPRPGSALLIQFDADGQLVWGKEPEAMRRGNVADAPSDALYLGDVAGEPVLTWRTAEKSENDQVSIGSRIDLRTAIAWLPTQTAHAVGYAHQLLEHKTRCRHCSQCGSTLVAGEMWSLSCPACGHASWPPVSPAVLLLIHDDQDRILMAQKPGWGDRWSILAGFVEPGESLEACCHREALEEVGVEIADPSYVGSQPWPFPHQLMVAFTARYLRGNIVPDPGELADARWFASEALPNLPPPHSLSRQTIDHFVRKVR